MFTINISFKDALTCFEALSKNTQKEDLGSIEREFFRYAQKKANVGDTAAREWVQDNKDKFNTSSGGDRATPMSFFAGMKRPAYKDNELHDIDNDSISEAEEKALIEDIQKIEKTEKVLAVLSLETKKKRQEEIERVKQKLEVKKPLTKNAIDNAMHKLNALSGMGRVKQQIRGILEAKLIEQRREKAGLKILNKVSNHMVFTGNAGTGKTTVARLTAKIFKDLNFVSKGHLTEVSRTDLVGEYIGQTDQMMKALLKRAIGGVLFIDEAYSLHKPESGNDYGRDVVNSLIKMMEDHRDNLVVIMAGYPDLMNSFLKSNPGLKSRIPHHIEFEDMKDDQLCHIFEELCTEYDYKLTKEARTKLSGVLKALKRQEESEFPNARGARNLFEEVLRRQSKRLLDKNYKAKAKLQEIMPEDIPSKTPLKQGNVVHLPRD